MVGNQDTGGQNAPPGAPQDVLPVLYELAEALTALGNFVAVMNQLSDSGRLESDEHREPLVGASVQHKRASVAAHRLLQLLGPSIPNPRK
jgi:hypothetical protein